MRSRLPFALSLAADAVVCGDVWVVNHSVSRADESLRKSMVGEASLVRTVFLLSVC